MYRCDKCGKVIESLPKTTDCVPFGDGVTEMKLTTRDCACGGEYLDAVECRCCGEIKHTDDGISYNNEICHACLDKIAKNLKRVRVAYESNTGEIDEMAKFIIECGLNRSLSQVAWDSIETDCNFAHVRCDVNKAVAEYIKADYNGFAEKLIEKGLV